MNNKRAIATLRWLAIASSCAFTINACSTDTQASVPRQTAVATLGSTIDVIASPEASGSMRISQSSVRKEADTLSPLPSAGTVAFTDDFEADKLGGAAAGWTPSSGTWRVCQPALATHEYCAASTTGGASFAGSPTWSNYYVDALVTHANFAQGGVAVLGRVQDAHHFYELEIRNSVQTANTPMWYILRYDGTTWLEVAGGPFVTHADSAYRLRLAFAANTLSAYVAYDKSTTAFSPLGSGTDASYASGNVGLRSWGTSTGTFDDVSVTLNGSAQPTPTPTPAPTSTPAPVNGVAMYDGCPIFTPGDWYNKVVASSAVDPNSSNYIASISATDGTGFYGSTGIEKANFASASTTMYKVHPKVSWHAFPNPYPVPNSPYIEPGGDEHYIALLATPPDCHLYESYSTTFSDNTLSAYSGRDFDLSKPFVVLPNGYSSAMASGLSIFAGMVKYEELAGGIHHALNFSAFSSAPCNCYTAPASSTDGLAYDGPVTAYELPYGGHLRLKASFDDSGFGPQSKAIAEAMKQYGMYLADTGGHYSNNNAVYLMNPENGGSWNSGDLGALGTLRFTDFDVLTVGTKTNR